MSGLLFNFSHSRTHLSSLVAAKPSSSSSHGLELRCGLAHGRGDMKRPRPVASWTVPYYIKEEICCVLFRGSRWDSGESLEFGVTQSSGLKLDSVVSKCVTLDKLLFHSEAPVLICEMEINITFQLQELN